MTLLDPGTRPHVETNPPRGKSSRTYLDVGGMGAHDHCTEQELLATVLAYALGFDDAQLDTIDLQANHFVLVLG